MKSFFNLPPLFGWLAFIILTSPAFRSFAAEPQRWILITAPGLQPALKPLADQRRKQGFNVEVVVTTNVITPEELRSGDGTSLKKLLELKCPPNAGRAFVLLAGDVKSDGLEQTLAMTVPPLRGETGRMTGKTSDHGFGLPAKNGTPRIAVGRFPARTVKEALDMVQKTLRFEREPVTNAWRNHLTLIVGNPGGGPMAEMFVQQALRADLAKLHPVLNVRTLFESSASKYFVPASRLRDVTTRWLEEGALFSVYMGHSRAAAMWSTSDFMTRADWSAVRISSGPGVFFTCGCFACQVEGRDGEGFGLAAMRNGDGPVAVIGATGESYAAAGQLAADGLLSCLSKPPLPKRLGDYWLAVQSGLAQSPIDESIFKLYDQFDGSGGKVPLATQRLEHLEMWTLLGDPALHLQVPSMEVSLDTPEIVAPGNSIRIRGTVPKAFAGARMQLTLERLLDSAPPGLEKLPANLPENREAREQIALRNNHRANDLVLVRSATKADGTKFSCQLETPATMPWSNVLVRAWAFSDSDALTGVRMLNVQLTTP